MRGIATSPKVGIECCTCFFAVGDEAGVEAEADTSADVNGAVANAKVAEPGFDPGTFGLWAQHAEHCATPLMFYFF